MKTILKISIFFNFFLIVINGFGQSIDIASNKNKEPKDQNQIVKLEKEDTKDEDKKENELKTKELKKIKFRMLQDNGFLVEEAYSQEEDSIQHSLKFRRSIDENEWELYLEEEIPLGNEKHQVSVSIPIHSHKSDEIGKVRGFGDIEIGYRYQLLGGEFARISFAPSLSAILPIGSYRKGTGKGGIGIGISLPVSIALNSRFMAHSNLGVTLTPFAKNDNNETALTKNIEAGQSFVWLAHPKFNPLIEFVWERNQKVKENKYLEREHEIFLNPGFRFGHTFRNGLTMVPGVSFPIGIGSSSGETGVLFYLSFEQLFKRKEN